MAGFSGNYKEEHVLDTLSKLGLQDFFLDVAQARQSALLLDYDGTLAPFRQDRYEAIPYTGVSPLLKEIMATGRTRLVLITGRRAHEAVRLLDISPHPEIWGTHGLERLHCDGSYEITPMDSHTHDALSAADEWVDGLKLHHLAEHKTGSLALHWRGLTDDEAKEVRGNVLLGWLSIADRAGLRLDQLDDGVEIRMADRNKGDAVRTILTEMDDDTPVAYLGDDQSDEDAFRMLQDRGLCVLVRPQWRETAANLWLRPPVQLLTFLRDWLAACQRMPTGASHGQWAMDSAATGNVQGQDGRRSER